MIRRFFSAFVLLLASNGVGLADEPGWERDEVLADRGAVRLLLTGRCGPGHQGRTVVLQNRGYQDSVQVATEVSRWTRGTFKSSSRDHHTLAGQREKHLGCTRLSEDVEMRYALVKVSDNAISEDSIPKNSIPKNSAPEDSNHDYGRHSPRPNLKAPSRDFISFTKSGTCGSRGEGQRVVAVNRHPNREIVIFIERVRKVGGTMKSRSTKSYRLGGGAEQVLGCNQQGNSTQQFYLTRTK